ncbi:MAG: DedA family protein, partial [Chloroflexota bacterium]
RWIGIRRSHVELADRWFAHYGLGAVFVGRFVPAVRTYISFPGGLARVALGAFAGLTFLGTLIWSAVLAVAGYEVGANYTRIAGPIEKAAIVFAVLLVITLIAWLIRGRISEAKA